MSSRWSVPLFRLIGIEFRLHLIFLVWIAIDLGRAAIVAEISLAHTAIAVGCLLAAVILHELAHGFAARRFGGGAEQSLLWPLGALSEFRDPPGERGPLLVAVAGPAVNLLAALLLLPYVLVTDQGNSVLLQLGPLHSDPDPIATFFGANCDLVLFNLLPAFPLDGARAFLSILGGRTGEEVAKRKLVLASRFTAITLVALAFFAPLGEGGSGALLGIAIIVLFSAESVRRRGTFTEEESWLDRPNLPSEGRLQRWWRQRGELQRELRDEAAARERVADEARLDDLLAKVHREGIETLNRQDRRFLERVGRRYRGKEED